MAFTGHAALKRLAIRLLPIAFFMFYLNLTVFIFAFGPWPWPVRHGNGLYLFIFAAHTALFLGYVSGSLGAAKAYHGRWNMRQLLLASLTLHLLLLVPTSLSRTGTLLPNVLAGLTSPASVYYSAVANQALGGNLLEYVRLILGPVLVLLLPLSIFYWQHLSTKLRIGAVAGILCSASLWIAIGTNKGLADIIIMIPSLLAASYFSGMLRVKRRHLIGFAVMCVAGFLLFFAYFTFGNIDRTKGGLNYFNAAKIYADEDNFMMKGLPPNVQTGITAFTSYLTQGYYALSLALDEPFVPTYGVGNSMFLYRNAIRFGGDPQLEFMTYPARIEYLGWDRYGLWSSIYPWIASDVSFSGTIIVVFMIGRLFALSWVDTLRGQNPFAVAVFAQFVIMLFYFSANNQLMQTGEGFMAFWGSLILWYVTRRRFIWSRLRHAHL